MDGRNTKQEILNAALELFSVQGYEATSISQIADAVGIRKASLYSHFKNKQAILDSLVEQVLAQYHKQSLFSPQNEAARRFPQTQEEVAAMVLNHVHFILHTPYVSKARKMLVIEQFRNPDLAKLQTKQNYTDVMGYFTSLMTTLIRRGVLAGDDPELMAMQFFLPISSWINVCDREPDREPEIMALMEKHIRQFFKLYQPN